MLTKSKKSTLATIQPNQPLIELKKAEKVNSIAEMFSGEYSAFSLMKRDGLTEELIDVIKLLLINLNAFFATNQQMTKEQIRLTAEFIMDEFYYFNICDLKLAFNKMRKEKLYGQLSPNFIINKLEEHREERFSNAESISISKHQAEIGKPIGDDFIEKFYNHKKKHPIIKDAKDLEIEDKEKFQHFKSDYERKKLNSTTKQ